MTTTESIDVLDIAPALMPVTPSWCHALARANCPHVLRFCSELRPSASPVVVPVRPDLLYGTGPMGRCYKGVDEYREKVGGTYQHGWMIWQTEGIYLRAFHHCVHWDGTVLTDVSPQLHRTILFLPTAHPGVPDEVYLENQCLAADGVPSQYYPLGDSALAWRIVSTHEAKDRALKHSSEWFGLLDEIAVLEAQFHEWSEAKSSAARRRKAARRRAKDRGSTSPVPPIVAQSALQKRPGPGFPEGRSLGLVRHGEIASAMLI